MTRLLQSGWETGDITQIGSPFAAGVASAPTVVTATPTPRSGSYCMKCAAATTSLSGFQNRTAVVIGHASKTELFYAFAFYRNDSEGFTVPDRVIFYTYDSAGSVGLCLTCEPDGTVRIYCATTGGASPIAGNLTLIGTSATSILANTWTHIEVHVITATGATGTAEVRINGASVISVATVRTAQTNANTTGFGLCFTRMTTTITGTAGTYVAFDDLRVNDTAGTVNNTWCGDENIIMLKPNAAGDLTQFTRGGTDSGSNFGQVDELPPNDLTDYVYDSVVGHTDLYNTTTATIVSVSAVEVVARAFNVDGSGGSLNLVTKTAAGQSDGTAQTVTGVPSYFKRLLETDPADSGAWTQAKIDALQVGVKVAS